MQMVLTRIWSAAYSLASDLVRLMPAARETLVGNARASGALPPTIVALTMLPPPRARMIGTTSRHTRTAPITLRSRSSCQAASSTSSSEAAADLPALLTAMSTPPKRSTAAATNRSMSAAFDTSAGTARTSDPVVEAIVSATSRRCASRRAQIATLQPSAASFSAVARPNPSLAPVMIATRSLSPSSSIPPAPLQQHPPAGSRIRRTRPAARSPTAEMGEPTRARAHRDAVTRLVPPG